MNETPVNLVHVVWNNMILVACHLSSSPIAAQKQTVAGSARSSHASLPKGHERPVFRIFYRRTFLDRYCHWTGPANLKYLFHSPSGQSSNSAMVRSSPITAARARMVDVQRGGRLFGRFPERFSLQVDIGVGSAILHEIRFGYDDTVFNQSGDIASDVCHHLLIAQVRSFLNRQLFRKKNRVRNSQYQQPGGLIFVCYSESVL
jgi:hypothetical protein